MTWKRLGVTRATAAAAANAVIRHTKQGAFVSQYVFMDEEPRDENTSIREPAAGRDTVDIDGRSNRGDWIRMKCEVVFKEVPKTDFPVERVCVSTPDPKRTNPSAPFVHFECTFGDNDIVVREIRLCRHDHDSLRCGLCIGET